MKAKCQWCTKEIVVDAFPEGQCECGKTDWLITEDYKHTYDVKRCPICGDRNCEYNNATLSVI